MNYSSIWISDPILSHAEEVWFSAYGFGWGYRAFSLSYEAVQESLGASGTSEMQILLAFQSGKQALLRAILLIEFQPTDGKRINLSLDEDAVSAQPESHARK